MNEFNIKSNKSIMLHPIWENPNQAKAIFYEVGKVISIEIEGTSYNGVSWEDYYKFRKFYEYLMKQAEEGVVHYIVHTTSLNDDGKISENATNIYTQNGFRIQEPDENYATADGVTQIEQLFGFESLMFDVVDGKLYLGYGLE